MYHFAPISSIVKLEDGHYVLRGNQPSAVEVIRVANSGSVVWFHGAPEPWGLSSLKRTFVGWEISELPAIPKR